MVRRSLTVLLVILLVSTSVTVASPANNPSSSSFAQNRPVRPSLQQQAQQVPQAQRQPRQTPPTAAPVPVRTEILNFENWTVTCREFEDPKKRDCSAFLRVTRANTNQTLFTWTVGLDATKGPTATINTPTGVLIAPGVELQLDKTPVRKVPYIACDSSQCSATMPVDSILVRDMIAASNAELAFTAVNGSKLQFKFPINGFARAYAALK